MLVAENGGGKTSFLDGIAIGLSPLLRYFSSADQRLSGPGIKDNDFRLSSDTSASEPTDTDKHDLFPETLYKPESKRSGNKRLLSSDYVQVNVEAVGSLRWDNWRGASEGKQPETKIGQSELMAFASAILDSFKSANPKLMPVFAYYGARRGWIVIPERLRESKQNYTHPTSALLGALDSLSDFGEMLKWFDIEEASELRANVGNPTEEYERSAALKGVRSAITALLGGAYVNPRFNKKHKFVVEPKTGPGELQVSQLSQGYQSMLAMGMDFARRLALANSHLEAPSTAPAIMLVDEVDLHLHPSWQQRVLPDLMQAFPNTQFIVTTHSPQVLTTVKRECIRILAQDEQGAWSAFPPDQEIKGLESSTVLNDVMAVNPIPNIPEAQWLRDYTALIETGSHDSEEGKALRVKLIDLYGEQHTTIKDCARLIRFQAFKRNKQQPAGQ